MTTDGATPSLRSAWEPTLAMPLDGRPRAPDLSSRLMMAVEASRTAVKADTPIGADLSPPLRLVCVGLKPVERRLLEGTVLVSQRRTPRLELLPEARVDEADVVIVDARDPTALAWAQQQSGLAARRVIWIDGQNVPPGHCVERRPVQWPVLPMILARVLEQGPPAHPPAAAPATPSLATPDHGKSPAAAAPGPATPAAAAAASTILVVDDSLAVRSYLRSQLEAQGLEVVDAADAATAITLATSQRFAAVLMDVLMPGTDGYEACRQIKGRLRGARSVPVIMLTSKSSPFDRIRGKMAGCDAYLTKPVETQELSQVLAQHGARRAAPAASPPAVQSAAAAVSALARPI